MRLQPRQQQRERSNEKLDNRSSLLKYRAVTHSATPLTKYYKFAAFILILVVVPVVILNLSANKNRSISKNKTLNIPENSQSNHDEKKSLVQPIVKLPDDEKKSLVQPIVKLPDHRCNRGDEGSCECAQSDPMKPVPRNTEKIGPGWKRAFEMNLALTNNTKTVEDEVLDVVLLGDSITEDWNGRRLGQDDKFSLPIIDVFKTLFQKKSSGEVNGIALGISGDRVRYFYQIISIASIINRSVSALVLIIIDLYPSTK